MKEKTVEETVDEIMELLEHQKLPDKPLLKLLGKFIREERRKGENEDILLIKLFLYGDICGKRTERAKGRAAAINCPECGKEHNISLIEFLELLTINADLRKLQIDYLLCDKCKEAENK